MLRLLLVSTEFRNVVNYVLLGVAVAAFVFVVVKMILCCHNDIIHNFSFEYFGFHLNHFFL